MTCEHCHKIATFNRECHQCTVRWLRMLPDRSKRKWLKDYREKHGRDAMLQIIQEIQSDDTRGTEESPQ